MHPGICSASEGTEVPSGNGRTTSPRDPYTLPLLASRCWPLTVGSVPSAVELCARECSCSLICTQPSRSCSRSPEDVRFPY